jgi:hypothetical protein
MLFIWYVDAKVNFKNNEGFTCIAGVFSKQKSSKDGEDSPLRGRRRLGG